MAYNTHIHISPQLKIKNRILSWELEKINLNKMNQTTYTKEDVLKAGEIGEINHHDVEHIVSLLDEAKELNKNKKKQ